MDKDKQARLLIETFILPSGDENVCEYLCGYDKDENGESWCSRNCGVVNDGTCPSMECYLTWLEMKR